MLRKLIFIFVLIIPLGRLAYANSINPYEVLKSIKSELRGEAAFDILNHDRLVSSPSDALQHIEYLLERFKEIKDTALVCTYYETKAHYYSLQHDRINNQSTWYHIVALDYAERNGIEFEQVRQSFVLGNYYFKYGKPIDAYRYFLKSLELINKIGKEVPKIWDYYNQMAQYFYAIEDFDITLELLDKLSTNYKSELKPRDNLKISNIMGLSYLNKGDTIRARECFDEVYLKSSAIKDTTWMGIAQGNIGDLYMDNADYEKALECFLIDYNYNSRPGGDSNSLLKSLKKTAQIYYKLGEYERALMLISEYIEKVEVKPAWYKDLTEVYELRMNLYKQLGRSDEQLSDSKNYNRYNFLYSSIKNEEILEKERLQIERNEYNRPSQYMNIIKLCAFILGFIIVFLLFINYRKRSKKRKKSKSLPLIENSYSQIMSLRKVK